MFDKVLNTPLYACNFSEDNAIDVFLGILQKISEQLFQSSNRRLSLVSEE